MPGADSSRPIVAEQARSSLPTLERKLGPFDGAAIVVSNVIGGGIFIVPAVVAQLAPDPWAMLGVWLVGGALAFSGALAYAELAALRPRAGGEYVYLKEAYGPLLGFLTGWTSFVAGFSGAMAASAVGMATILGRFIPVAADTTPIFSVALPFVSFTFSPRAAVALAAIVGLSAIHSAGLGPGRVVQNLLAGAKVATLVAVVALGFSIGRGSVSHYAGGESIALANWVFALIPVMFSYSGWNAAAYVSEEVRSPERNVPRALLMGTAAVVLIYVFLNMVYLYAMPVEEFPNQATRIGDVAVERLFGSGAGGAWAAASIVMIAASISAMVLAGPRVYYAMARDGLFFDAAARVHPRFRTPVVAIVAQAGLERRPRLDGHVRRACGIYGLCCRVVRGRRGVRGVRASVAASDGSPALPRVGLPSRPAILRGDKPVDCRQCPPGEPLYRRCRPSRHRARSSALFLDARQGPEPPLERHSCSAVQLPGRRTVSTARAAALWAEWPAWGALE